MLKLDPYVHLLQSVSDNKYSFLEEGAHGIIFKITFYGIYCDFGIVIWAVSLSKVFNLAKANWGLVGGFSSFW